MSDLESLVHEIFHKYKEYGSVHSGDLKPILAMKGIVWFNEDEIILEENQYSKLASEKLRTRLYMKSGWVIDVELSSYGHASVNVYHGASAYCECDCQ